MQSNELQFGILDLEARVAKEAIRQSFEERLPRARLTMHDPYTY